MSEIRVTQAGWHGDEFAARLTLEGAEHAMRYRLPGLDPVAGNEALAVALLPLAMNKGLPIELPSGISPRLDAGLDQAQKLLGGWWPEWSRVEVRPGANGVPSPPPGDRGVACFFTGGVDSFYSVLTAIDELDALIYVHGFDVPLAKAEWREFVAAPVRAAAAELGLELIEVETDLRLTVRGRGCDWGRAHGAGLASVAHLAASRFRKVLLPASYSSRFLDPWGSHSQLDPLWSTEAMEVVHHGMSERPKKLAAIAESEIALRHLRCCFLEPAPGQASVNCGTCEKCVRTMVSLHLAGGLERCETLPRRLSPWTVVRQPVGTPGKKSFLRENLRAARAAGDLKMIAALRVLQVVGPQRARGQRWRKEAPLRLRRLRRRRRRLQRRLRRRLRTAAGRRWNRSARRPRARDEA